MPKTLRYSLLITLLLAACLPGAASAHFGLVLPSNDIVSQGESRTLNLQVKFVHPLEQHYMEMAKPSAFAVVHRGTSYNLLETLQPQKGKSPDQTADSTYWTTDFTIKRPGDYTFHVEPAPYWEPGEDLFIVHYTKVCVQAFGLEEGWDEPIGLETEIVPLTRPYGLWTNNLFSGQVLLKGEPVAFAEIEIEYLNESADNPSIVTAPADPYVTQVVKADSNGVFHYAMPRAGWWGFAALSEADWTLKHDGEDKAVEIGAVYWVRTRDMK
jgi:cobalt/nickel transport protein